MKNNLPKIGILILIVLLFIFWQVDIRNEPEVKSVITESSSQRVGGIHAVNQFDEELFYQGVLRAEAEYKELPNQINGGIVPHHFFASFIVADFFKKLAEQNPSTVVLVGPNHLEQGNFDALTSFYAWETSLGVVEPDVEIINALVAKGLLMQDEQVLPTEHSVTSLLPFIEFYLPDTRVVPIILSGMMNKSQVEILAENLVSLKTTDVVIVAPVDLSHNLVSEEAQLKDEETLEAIENLEYDRLLSFGNEHLDSAPSIVTLLMAMEGLDSRGMEILHHTNSGELQNNQQIDTTSYFSIVFY